MKASQDWNYERYRTRDLLLEYDLPPHPCAVGLAMLYPWAIANNYEITIESNSPLSSDLQSPVIVTNINTEGHLD